MKKILPGIYKGKVKNNKNEKESTFKTNEKNINEVNEYNNEINVDKQIKDIFSSVNYVYKADVRITLMDKSTIEKTIIGRTNNSLITMDDELIDISKIERIDFLS